MRRSLLILAVCALVPVFAIGQDRTKSVVSRVSSGSVVLTNDLWGTTSEFALRPALELKRIEFDLPTTVTNTFAIQYIRTYSADNTTSNVVSTETIGGVTLAYTNAIPVPGASYTFTNSITVAITTNNTNVQVYDADDFGEGLTFEPNDVITYSFTETSAFDLIQVYTVRQRP